MAEAGRKSLSPYFVVIADPSGNDGQKSTLLQGGNGDCFLTVLKNF